DPINPKDPKSPKYPAEDQWKKDVTSTVHYVVSDSNATAPADKVQNAQWTRTLILDKVTGEVLSSTQWAANKANYDAVPTPGLTGYYADKGSVASKTVTQENLEETVTYNPLGNLVPKPETPKDPNFPSTPEVKYPNDPTDPTKPGQPVVPNVPGYKPYLPDPKDPSKPGKPVEPGKPITPDKPGDDTPIIYVPIVNDVKKPTKQTVKFEGAGDKTPGDNVQDDFTFTGKENKASGTTTWNEKSHTYGKVSVPVIPGYYADKTEAGGKTVTPENPEATDTVTYKPLGKLVPKPEKPNDPNFPSTPEVKYPNDPTDPGKPGKPVVPNVPGYKPYLPDPKDPSKPGKPVEPGKPITPENPGDDTPIIYVPIVNDVKKPTKQTVKFEGAGDKTPGDNVQDDFTFTGKENKASGTTTWNEKSHTYGKVSVPVIPGYYADKTEAGGKTVTPENPEAIDTVTYKPLGSLVPKPEKSDDPKFPSTPDVKYPNDPTDPGKPGKPIVPDVPGYNPYLPDPKDPSKPGQPVEPGKELPNLPTNPGEDTPIIYVPIVNDVKKPTKQTVKFEGAGDKTPADNVQDDFTFTGKENKASGTTTWTEKSHTYGKVSVPVIPGYYADKTEAGGKTVTPENPEATDTVTYKPLGKLVPKPERPNDPNFPSTPEVKYPNDPTDPGKPGKPVVPDVPGYKPYLPDPKDPSKPGKPVEPGKPITPENPGDDTPIIYVPVKPDTPVVPNPEPQTPAKPDPKPLDPEKVVQELPNTGTDSNTVMTGLGIIGMATTLLGLARKKKED
ncbi:mucin-binding protein, partial [Streptococcus taonis]